MNCIISKLLALAIAITVLVSSCNKENGNEDLNAGKATVTLKMSGVGFVKTESNVAPKSSTKKIITASKVQHQEVSFNEEYKVSATLTPISSKELSLKGSARAESVSNGAITQPLEKSTPYNIKVYEKGNRNKEILSKIFKHGIDDSNIQFELSPGEYTFVTYGLKGYTGSTYTYAPFHWKEDITIIAGKNITLNMVLSHLFAEVTATLNTGSIGNIEKINGGFVGPTYSINSGDGGKIDNFTGIVTYGTYQGPNFFTFPTQPSSSSWTSHSMPLQVKYTDKGEIELYGVTINGIMGNIRLTNLIFEEGVKYDLQLNLSEKKEKIFKIGNLEFAGANLFYDATKGTHYFLARDNGSYFFANYVKPKKMGILNSKPSNDVNGNNGDPCKSVQPLDTWRLPTETEMKTLLTSLNITAPSNSNQNIFYTKKGIGFGTRQNLGDDPSDYLFLYFSGNYRGSDRNYNDEYYNITKIGRYLLSSVNGGYAQLGISYAPTSNSPETKIEILGAPDLDTAISVRCVKN